MSKLPTWDNNGIVYDAKIPLNPDNYMLLRHLFRGATIADVQYNIATEADINEDETEGEYLLMLLKTKTGDLISLSCSTPLSNHTSNMNIEIGEVDEL